MSPAPSVSPSIAVVICTHQPRLDYLGRALQGLRAQTLPVAEWDLLIVDNASTPPIGLRVDLAWHPNARCVIEAELGLTNARLRGIRETSAPLLVFVDDDNVLAPDYLAKAADIDRSHTFLGAWGGHINGVYEVPPPAFCRQHAHMLAVRDVLRDAWGNTTEDFRSIPCGAGLCIRRTVAELWAAEVASRPESLQLGRIGKNLGACEDGHLALHSIKLDLGTGVFHRLSLDHLIPKERLTLEYFTRLAAGHAYSYNLLRHLLGQPLLTAYESRLDRLLTLYRRRQLTPENRAIAIAMEKGRADSVRDLTR